MSPSDAALRDLRVPTPVLAVPDDYLHVEQTLSSWIFTTDHKRIGILYLVSITGFFVLGAVAAGLIRLALVVPDGSILSNDVYNRMFTLHGVIMVWFFLVPSIPNTLGNFLLPFPDLVQRPYLPVRDMMERAYYTHTPSLADIS